MKVRLADLALLGIATIYFPLLPIGIETQPDVIVFLLLVGGSILYSNFIKDRGPEMRWLRLLIFLLVGRTLFDTFAYHQAPVSLLKYLIPLLFYIAMRRINLSPSPRFFDWFLGIHCILALLYFAGLANFLQFIFKRYSTGQDTVRGFSFLSQEPSYAASYLFAIFIAIYVSHFPRRKMYLWTTLALIAITKSLIGVVLILLGILLTLESGGLVFLIGGVVATIAVLSTVLVSSDTSRIGQFVAALRSIDANHVLLSFVILEPSGTVRILMNGYSFFMGFHSVIGYGIGSFSSTFIANARAYGANIFLYNDALADFYRYNLNISPQSAFAALAYETGIFSILYTAPYFYCIYRTRRMRKLWIVAFVYAMICLVFQSEISNPTPLYILMLLANYVEYNAGVAR